MVIHAATLDDGRELGTQSPPVRLELYAGDVLLGTFPVNDDQDIARIVNVCPVALTHYIVTLAP